MFFYEYKTQSAFESDLSAGNVNVNGIVFIRDTGKIWHNNYYYGPENSSESVTSGVEPVIIDFEVELMSGETACPQTTWDKLIEAYNNSAPVYIYEYAGDVRYQALLSLPYGEGYIELIWLYPGSKENNIYYFRSVRINQSDLSQTVDFREIDFNGLTEIPAATSSTYGGIKIGYTTNSQNYAVELDEDGKAFVEVPWTSGAGSTSPVIIDYANDMNSGNGNVTSTFYNTLQEAYSSSATVYIQETTEGEYIPCSLTTDSNNSFIRISYAVLDVGQFTCRMVQIEISGTDYAQDKTTLSIDFSENNSVSTYAATDTASTLSWSDVQTLFSQHGIQLTEGSITTANGSL